VRTRYENRRQELQVRLTAQRILGAHLRPEAAGAFWPGIDLDLTRAYLHTLDLTYCHIGTAQFDGAEFTGEAEFIGAHFAGAARFRGRVSARIRCSIMYISAERRRSRGRASASTRISKGRDSTRTRISTGCVLAGGTQYSIVHISTEGRCSGGHALFRWAHFIGGDAWFLRAQFAGPALFDFAKFTGYAWFDKAKFAGYTWFEEKYFSKGAGFNGARVACGEHVVLPAGWTTRVARMAEGEKEGWLYVVRDKDSSEQQPDQGRSER
jgi:uncharacterized protein YjbI with pentapeptide repeats